MKVIISGWKQIVIFDIRMSYYLSLKGLDKDLVSLF